MSAPLPRVVAGSCVVRTDCGGQLTFGTHPSCPGFSPVLSCPVLSRVDDASAEFPFTQVAFRVAGAVDSKTPALVVGWFCPCSGAGDIALPSQLAGCDDATVLCADLGVGLSEPVDGCLVFRWSDCPFLAGFCLARGAGAGDLVAVPC